MFVIEMLSNNGFIMVNKMLMKKISLEAAVIIGELCSEYKYWHNKNGLTKDGYFFSTAKNIEENTSIKEKKQRQVMKVLEELEIIETTLRGLPAKRYVRINEKVLIMYLMDVQDSPIEQTSSPQMTELEQSNEAGNKNNLNKINNNNNNNIAAVEQTLKNTPNIPNYRKLSPNRKSAINARLSEYKLEEVLSAIESIALSDFFRDSYNSKANWYTIDWIFNPNNFLKIVEGKYVNKKSTQQQVVSQPVQQKIFDPSQLFAD